MGLATSILGISPAIELSHDLVVVVLLPALVFEGTIELDLGRLRSDLPLVLALTVLGLPLSIVILGALGTVAFGFPTLVALVFAAVVLPTDPAAVIALFEEFDAPERLAVAMEGESLLNDGVAIVIFSTLFEAFRASQESGEPLGGLATPERLAGFGLDVLVVGGGGLGVGLAVGYAAHQVVLRIDDRMADVLLTVVVAYGSFLLAERYLALSGVLAAVFVVLVRAAVTYPLVTALNRFISNPVPLYCQNIFVWGGLHTVVPVALALSLPPGMPHVEKIRTMVFGVAVIGILIQGVLMPTALRVTGLAGA